MGHGGRRYFFRGIISYAVSPLHLKILSSVHPMSMVRRVCEEIPYVVPAPLLGWFVYKMAERGHRNNKLKKPGDFDDEDDIGNLKTEEEAENCPPDVNEENCAEEENQK